MSFILDALKKSETERQRADAPALYEMKMAPPRRGVATWLIVLGALLVINILVLSVVLLRGTHSAAPQIDANSTGTPPAPAPAAVAPVDSAQFSAAPAPAAPAAVAPAADTAANSAGAASDDDAPAVEPARGGASPGEVPSYEQAAGAPGANLPELKLDLHTYAANPADRFVYLNMTMLKEGQSAPSGVKVEAITPDGAILSWRGSKFFLQSQ